MGEHVDRFEGDGRVRRVVTTEGTVVECDAVVAGVGIEPVVDLAVAAGLEVDNGILVDRQGVTSHPDVFAAGDVANQDHPVLGRRVRVEHFDNALKQGAAGGRACSARPTRRRRALVLVGPVRPQPADGGPRAVVGRDRGAREPGGTDFVAFYMKDGAVEAVAGLDRGREVRRARDLVRAGVRWTPRGCATPTWT